MKTWVVNLGRDCALFIGKIKTHRLAPEDIASVQALYMCLNCLFWKTLTVGWLAICCHSGVPG